MARLKDSENGGESARKEPEDEARQRLALTRVLIWAEREAASQNRPDVARKLQDAIATLHREEA